MNVEQLYGKRQQRSRLVIGSLFVLLVSSVLLTLAIGPVPISLSNMVRIICRRILTIDLGGQWDKSYEVILLDVRLPRILLAGVVGAALSSAGCAMQGLFRNPMASPYVTGISSGAAFGASLVIVLGLSRLAVPVAAFLFAIFTAFLVYNIAQTRGRVPVETLLLAGIAISLLFSALVSFTQYIAGERQLREIVFWLMGGFWASNWDRVLTSSPPIIVGVILLPLWSRDLNIMLMGERTAADLGIKVGFTRKLILVLASLITAAAVSVSGIIGFVGLIIPHIMRLLVGPDHRILLPSSTLCGAIFLIWTDTLARQIIAPTELPVGIITALCGAPFFLYLLRKRKNIWNSGSEA